MDQNVTRDYLTQLGYGIGYFHHYRQLYSVSIDKSHTDVQEIYSEKTDLQKRSIELMLELELVNNAVMYCMDFAAVFLSLQKPEKGIIKTISSIHETGSGSIKEFYTKIKSGEIDAKKIRDLMGYDNLVIDPEDEWRYNQSAERFLSDLQRMSKFFLDFYPIFSAYKHGMNIIPIYNEENSRFAFQIGNPDGSFDYMEMPPTWFYNSYDVIETIFRMFDRLVVPQISWILVEKMGVDLTQDKIKKTVESTEEEDPARQHKATLKLTYPWKIFMPGKPDPFY